MRTSPIHGDSVTMRQKEGTFWKVSRENRGLVFLEARASLQMADDSGFNGNRGVYQSGEWCPIELEERFGLNSTAEKKPDH